MSRKIKNSGLAKLCAKEAVQIGGLACVCHVKPRAINYYAAGLRCRRSRLEAGLAEFFNLTVPELRKKLGLPTRKGTSHD